jgi:CheY-like chemotaxis protein
MKSILIIEDNPANMELLTDILELEGYCVYQADTAPSGIEIARAVKPQLILMDVGLPEINGLNAAKALKQDPATENIPIIAVTAHVMKGDRERALAAGCDDYISKPINVRTITDTIRQFFGRPGSSKR